MKAFYERQKTAKTNAQRLAEDFGWKTGDLPQGAWTGFKPLPVIKKKEPAPEPTARTKQRAMARAKALDDDLAKEKAKIDGPGKAFRFRGNFCD